MRSVISNAALRNVLKVGLSLLIGGVFLWIAMRNLDLNEMKRYWLEIQTGWIGPFLVVALMSFYLRMERWKLLIEHDKLSAKRSTLLAGVLNGYAVNYFVPRLGEITRCYYVAKKEDKSVPVIIGTVVLERVIDMLALLVLFLMVIFFVITDDSIVRLLFGYESKNIGWFYFKLFLMLVVGVLLIGVMALGVRWLSEHHTRTKRIVDFIAIQSKQFLTGLKSILHIEHPFKFIVLTLLIWFCYVLMSYIPFAMLDHVSLTGLGMTEALVITVIASIGITIPSPGGVGTYHLLVQKSLFLLYNVPESIGMTYAIVSHASVFVLVMLITPISMLFNNQVKHAS
jgi:hypothetical protein